MIPVSISSARVDPQILAFPIHNLCEWVRSFLDSIKTAATRAWTWAASLCCHGAQSQTAVATSDVAREVLTQQTAHPVQQPAEWSPVPLSVARVQLPNQDDLDQWLSNIRRESDSDTESVTPHEAPQETETETEPESEPEPPPPVIVTTREFVRRLTLDTSQWPAKPSAILLRDLLSEPVGSDKIDKVQRMLRIQEIPPDATLEKAPLCAQALELFNRNPEVKTEVAKSIGRKNGQDQAWGNRRLLTEAHSPEVYEALKHIASTRKLLDNTKQMFNSLTNLVAQLEVLKIILTLKPDDSITAEEFKEECKRAINRYPQVKGLIVPLVQPLGQRPMEGSSAVLEANPTNPLIPKAIEEIVKEAPETKILENYGTIISKEAAPKEKLTALKNIMEMDPIEGFSISEDNIKMKLSDALSYLLFKNRNLEINPPSENEEATKVKITGFLEKAGKIKYRGSFIFSRSRQLDQGKEAVIKFRKHRKILKSLDKFIRNC